MALGDSLLVVVMIAVIGYMTLIRGKKIEKNRYSLVLFLPAICTLVHILICGFSYILLPLYVSAIIMGVMYCFRKRKWLFRACNAIIVILIICEISVPFLFGKIRVSLSYADAFKQTIEDMEQEYILSELKGIDYDALYEEYLPRFEQADADQDEVAAYIASLQFCYEFKDGHVNAAPLLLKDDLVKEARARLAGNDYGISLLTLSDNQTVAILVDEDSKAYEAGIRDGSVITNWDGKAISEIKGTMQCVYPGLSNFPVKENEEQYKSFFIAGMGDKQVEVTFINEKGEEQQATLSSMGSYAARLNRAIKLFLYSFDAENLSWEIQEGGHGYLHLTEELYGTLPAITKDYSRCGEIIEDMIGKMQEAGVKDLIIDMRNNGGGDDCMGMEIMSYFTDESQFYFADGEATADGSYQVIKEYKLQPNRMWGNLPIVLLVNSKCISAGDGFVYNMGQLDNVTIMGMSDTVGSFQATGGGSIMGTHGLCIAYPVVYQLNQDGSIMIDNDTSREAVVKRDMAIPITQETVEQLYGQEQDYELAYVKEYLESFHKSGEQE